MRPGKPLRNTIDPCQRSWSAFEGTKRRPAPQRLCDREYFWCFGVYLKRLTGHHRHNRCFELRFISHGRQKDCWWESMNLGRNHTPRWSRLPSPLSSSVERIHPILRLIQLSIISVENDRICRTLNDCTNSNPCLERTAAAGGIEPLKRHASQWQ